MLKKIKQKCEKIMDYVSILASCFFIVGIVYCLSPNMIVFVFSLIAIAMGTVLFIDLFYISCMILKRFKEKQKVSKRSENTKMTNGDRIRSMTDSELSVFLITEECKVCTHCEYNGEYGCDDEIVCGNYHLEDVWMKWLSSEYKEKKN